MGKTRAPTGQSPPPLTGVTIRELELDDLPAVFALGETLFTAEKWPNLYRTWDEYEVVDLFSSDGEFCLVAESGDKIVGFALGTLIQKRRSAWSYGYLLWLGVALDARGSGIGRRLLNRLTDVFVEEGARIMILDTEAENSAALDFFRSQGFGQENRHIYLSRNLTTHPEYLRRKKGIKPGPTLTHRRKAAAPVMAAGVDMAYRQKKKK